jgi:hypothetical protein
MKEVLTKKFWQGVKKTFYEALEDSPSENKTPPPPAPADDAPKEASPLGTSTSESPAGEHD